MPAEDSRVKDLGKMSGDVLLFGGPYSNFQATQALLAVARSLNIPTDRRICTGDVVAYCASPAETQHLLQGRCELVAGNCEKQLAVAADDCGCGFEVGSACDVLSKGWYPFASAAMSDADREYMRDVPDMLVFSVYGKRYAVIHGGVADVSRYLWSTSVDAEFLPEIEAVHAAAGPVDGIIAGHSGIAFERYVAGVHWINAGVIGMPPHDGQPDTVYVVLDKDGPSFERLTYDAGGASAAMIGAGLVQGYETALLSGYWPSEDILPAGLRRAMPLKDDKSVRAG